MSDGSMVGADIGGLKHLSKTLGTVESGVGGTVRTIGGSVNKLVGDAGWQGQDASTFRGRWDEDAMAAEGVAAAAKTVEGIINTLAGQLESAEKILQKAAAIARSHGVPVGEHGEPFIGPLPADKAKNAKDYAAVYQSTMDLADKARRNANDSLQKVLDQIGPPSGKGGKGGGGNATLSGSDKATLSDALRSLYTLPTAATVALRTRLASVRADYKQAKYEYSKLPKNVRGPGTPEWDAKRGLFKGLKEQQTKLARAEGIEAKVPLSRALSTSIGDLAPGLEDSSKLLADIPVLGTVAGGASTYFQVEDDTHTRHWSVAHAVAADGGSTAAGLIAGTAVAAAPFDGAAVVAVGVGYGVTQMGYELTHNAHWSANIHQYGVISGVGHSFADAGTAFGHDTAHMAEGLWHGIFG